MGDYLALYFSRPMVVAVDVFLLLCLILCFVAIFILRSRLDAVVALLSTLGNKADNFKISQRGSKDV